MSLCFFDADSDDDAADEVSGAPVELAAPWAVFVCPDDAAAAEDEEAFVLLASAACSTIVECWLKRRMRLALLALDFDLESSLPD